MQSLSQNASHSSPLNPQLHLEALSSLAEKLHETTQALLDLTHKVSQPDNLTEVEQQGPTQQPDEIRCFRVPGFMVLAEKEILREYQAEDVVDLIRKARDNFAVTSLFMCCFNDDYIIDSSTVRNIGETMARPLAMLDKACSILGDYEPQPDSSDQHESE